MIACTLVYLAVINTFSFCQLLIAVCMQTVCTCEHLWALISAFCAQCLVLCVLALFVLDQQIVFLISSFPTIDIFILLGETWHMFYMCTHPASNHVNVSCNPGLHITHIHSNTPSREILLWPCAFLSILLKIASACIRRCYPCVNEHIPVDNTYIM